MSEDNHKILIEVQDLKVYFPVSAGNIFNKKIGDIKAVDGISFHIRQGETLGLVGESGHRAGHPAARSPHRRKNFF
jgi:ABC-type oligopeptide transport system ATPase subunit